MPKKKTGQRKKAEKQKARQKEIGAKSKYISTQIILDRYCSNLELIRKNFSIFYIPFYMAN